MELKKILTNKITALSLGLALVLNIGLWLVLILFIKPSPEPIALHYTIYFGIDLIDQWYKVFYLAGIGLFILICNAFLAGFFFSKEKLVSYFLSIGSVAVQIILLLAVVLLIIYT